ncbi:hypothetical protein TWF481_008630 [Arthrobotrys musiformis]
MSARRPKRKTPTIKAIAASSSLSPNQHSLHDLHQTRPPLSPLSIHESSSEGDSEDDILAFLNPRQRLGLSSLQTTAPKLTMADIREKVAKNKARDEEIRRAQRLLEESESLNIKDQTRPSSTDIGAYFKSQEGMPAVLNVLNPGSEKSSQLPIWSFFSGAAVAHHIPLDNLYASIRDSSCTSAFLGPSDGEPDIRGFLVSGAMADCLEICSSTLESPLRQLLLDAVCLGGDEDISFACFTLITTLHKQFESILDPKGIRRIFELIGGSRHALDPGKPLEAIYQEGDSNNTDWPSFSYSPNWWNISLVLKMLSQLIQGLDNHCLQAIWGLVLRFSLDWRRMKEQIGQVEFLFLVERLLTHFELRGDTLIQAILLEAQASVTNRTLQVQLLGMLPVTSGFSHDFRKRLARLFLSGNPAYTREEPGPGILMGSIVSTLRSKEVRISKGESHAQLQNIIDIMNIAVDDARWCVNVLERDGGGGSENLLEKLIVHLKHSKEAIQEAGAELNIEKSNAKDSFAKLIIRLEAIRQKKRATQTVVSKYFRPNSRQATDNP